MISRRGFFAGVAAAASSGALLGQTTTIRSVTSGPWSSTETWEGGTVPAAGASVQVRIGHVVTYDVNSSVPIRFLHIAGTMRMATNRDTRLEVGVIKIQSTDTATEDGFFCDAHLAGLDPGVARAALLVGTAAEPVEPGFKALIRLTPMPNMAADSTPAIVNCAGRLELHGAPMSRTWVKLGAPVAAGDQVVTLKEPVTGWSAGDRIILTGTTRQIKTQNTFKTSVQDNTQTEERLLVSLDGDRITLDRPVQFAHICNGAYRGEVANLSRNVVVESADLQRRGHTMYHIAAQQAQ